MRRALEGLTGVKKAAVSFTEKQAMVYFEEGKVTVHEMIEAVNRTGFRARQVETNLPGERPVERKD